MLIILYLIVQTPLEDVARNGCTKNGNRKIQKSKQLFVPTPRTNVLLFTPYLPCINKVWIKDRILNCF